MVKQPRSRHHHDHPVPITGRNHARVADRAAGLGDVGCAALLGAVDAVTEGEEGV